MTTSIPKMLVKTQIKSSRPGHLFACIEKGACLNSSLVKEALNIALSSMVIEAGTKLITLAQKSFDF